MKRKNLFFNFMVSTLLLIGIVTSVYSADTAELPFKWALIMPTQKGGARSFDKDIHILKIKPGQQFGFYIKPIKNAFIYLYFFSPVDGLQPLFPGTFNEFDKNEYYEETCRLPSPADIWFHCEDQSKGDRIYLFASPARLKKLEKLTEKYLAGEKPQALKAVLDEMERLLSASVPAEMKFLPLESIAGVEKSENEITLRDIRSETLYAEIITFEINE